MLSEDERKRRRRLSLAKAKVKQFEARIQRAELRAAYWRRRVADLQFEQLSIVQPPLWPAVDLSETQSVATALDIANQGSADQKANPG